MKLKLVLGIAALLVIAVAVAIRARVEKSTIASSPKTTPKKTSSSPPEEGEGTGSVSMSKSGQAVDVEGFPPKKPISDPKGVASIDWIELRKAVLAGDSTRVGNVRGKVGPSDAGMIFALLNEIPAEVDESVRRSITFTLAKFLTEVETEESSGYLLALLTQGALLEPGTRDSITWQLGFRKYAAAAPALELGAFQDIGLMTTNDRRRERYFAMSALIHMEPTKYLALMSQELRSIPDTNLWCVTMAFRNTALMGKVDIGPAVVDLQAKFLAMPRENWWAKKFIGEALAQYANSSKSKSESVKLWLLSEVKGLLDPAAQAGLNDASREAYRDLLKFTETGKSAN